ncbi:MAG: clostripain-related cysteine peptidase [Hungatella sp.]
MKKIGVVLMAVVSAVIGLTGCGTDTSTAQTPTTQTPTTQTPTTQTSAAQSSPTAQTHIKRSIPNGGSWTVLVYLCGTDLETQGGCASINIAEMAEAIPSEQVNVVIETGGTADWAIDAISSEELQRWRVVPGDIELVDSTPLANMGDGNTLGEFLSWGVKTYPADKYACILWDHGGGSVAGIAADELFGGDTLDLKELAVGFSMAEQQFELIGFDACLMSTLETAAALSPYGRYMTASQEWEPGSGWDYAKWLSSLAENPSADGLAVGRVICDSFYEKCAVNGMESLATLAVTDLSKISALAAAFDAMAAEMKGFTATPEKLQPLTQAIVRAENYGGNNANEGYANMVDLGDLTLCAEGVLSTTGEAVLEGLIAAVPYHVEGSGRQKSNGLSVYVPLLAVEEEMNAYATLAAMSGEYLRFLEGMYDWEAPPNTVIHQPMQPTLSEAQDMPVTEPVSLDTITIAQALNRDEFQLHYSIDISEDGYILLNVDEGTEIINTVAFDLFYHDEETNSLWYLGSDYDVNESEDGTQFWDNFRNVWTIIGDKLCMMDALSFTDDYILYTVPVTVNGSATNLRMLYHMEAGEYEVIGTWDGMDGQNGMSSREVHKLKDGDVVTFLFAAADLASGEAYEFEGESFTVNGPVVAEEATLFDGDYYYQYAITDIFGNSYESDMARMSSVDGEITVELVE